MPPTFDFAEFPTLTTERLRLRRMTRDDADQIIALMGDPEVLRYLNEPPRDTPEKAIEFIDGLNGFFGTKEAVPWAVTHRDDDKLIGACNWHAWNREDRHVDIGYHFLRELWGRGYATEVSHAIIQWCFENLDVHRIAADCTDGNIASERVLLKSGFTFEGISRESCWEHERFVSLKLFGLLRSEYEKR
jgi:ribosomal-protein-alanine N-acetyltransferase